jgi:CBS domain-containing protein
MKQVSEVMKTHLEFCNPETRVPDLKYIFKKYNYDEIVIVGSDRHPLGIVTEKDVSDEELENISHPFDVKAGKIMTSIPAMIKSIATTDECLKMMESNQLRVLPVVDENGQCLGVVRREDLPNLAM